MGRNNYITKAESQLKYELVYKKVTFKEDMLCHLATKSNSVSQDFRLNGCITEKKLCISVTNTKRSPNFCCKSPKLVANHQRN